MAKTSWDLALLRSLREDGFTGVLRVTFKEGEAVAHETLGSAPKRRAKQVEKVEEKAASAAD